MSTGDISSIEKQKSDVSAGANTVNLYGSCVINEGILRLSEQQKLHYERCFENWRGDVSFFVPASGSGSRMFSGLIQFLETQEETDEIKKFFEELPEMALFSELPLVVREKYDSLQSIYLAEYLVSGEGMKFPSRPKGLIPFHVTEKGSFNPFQEQFRQAIKLLGTEGKIHFTIQKDFENQILESLKNLELQGTKNSVSFSYQDSDTDAYCFDANGELVMEGGSPLRRPAGHGALLHNLNELPGDLFFIKNIDNVQHSNKSALNQKVWKYCAGMLLEFKEEMLSLASDFSLERLKSVNDKYQFLSDQEVESCNEEKFQMYLKRPSRVCGMVINEGAPGGGPFWIEEDGLVTKQIVEKVQIAPEDNSIVEESSHFNPVFIALSKSDVFGNILDLNNFVDETKFLLVQKPYKEKQIRYRELPGLWNGSMHFWNSIFVEIPKEVFSPVKSVFDLMKEAHRP